MGFLEDEFNRRVNLEKEKAISKYGNDALLPKGNPNFNAIEYCLNEIIGLVRYSQIIQNTATDTEDVFLSFLLKETGESVENAAKTLGIDLLRVCWCLGKADHPDFNGSTEHDFPLEFFD